MPGLIGSLTSAWDVEQAVLNTLKTWLSTYLADVEEEHGLGRKTLERPPAPESYHGGTADAVAWDQDNLPEVIVIVEPVDEPEVNTSGYVQRFEVQVWCVVMGDDGTGVLLPEDSARQQASLYGSAVMGLVQHGELEGLPNLEWVRMSGAPRIVAPDTETRRQQASVTTFDVWIATVVDQNAGPVGANPKESPGYTGVEEPFEEPPPVETVVITIKAEQI